MKLAISTEGGNVAAHFGRCPAYTLIDITDGNVVAREEIPNPGHEPGFLPGYLADRGVGCIIAGGMGPRAQSLFAQRNITTIIGVQGPIPDVLEKFLKNELEAGEDLCDHHHGQGHQCGESSRQDRVEVPPGAKICLTATDKGLDAEIDPRFGRAAYFLILDPSVQQIEVARNPYLEESQGAGIRAAQMLVDKGVRIVLTGQVGPKADQVLSAAGVQVISGASGTIREAIQNFAVGVR
jgi:predicted Fe-Mo cluster-binding NifX family protein